MTWYIPSLRVTKESGNLSGSVIARYEAISVIFHPIPRKEKIMNLSYLRLLQSFLPRNDERLCLPTDDGS